MKQINYLFIELPLVSDNKNKQNNNDKNKISFQISRIKTLDFQKENSFLDSKTDIYITMIGYISNLSEFNDKSSGKYNSDLQLICNLWKEKKEKIFTLLKGVYTLVIYNTKTGGLWIFQDEYGYNQPLYYTIFNNTFYFSNNLKQLFLKSARIRKMDSESVRQFLLSGFLYFGNVVLGKNTLFKDVYKLLPSQMIFRKTFSENPKIISKKTLNKEISYWY